MSKPIDLKGKQNFEAEVLKSELPVLVDFWAPWCGPCQMMAPVLESLANRFEGKIKIAKIDTEEADNQGLSNEYRISSIPNLKLFKNGQVVEDYVGFKPEEMFFEELKKAIEK